MEDITIKRWITFRGRKLPVGEDGKIIKISGLEKDNINNQYKNREDKYDYYIEKDDTFKHNSIKALNLKDKIVAGQLDYKKMFDRYHVINTNVLPDYRRNGVGLEMAQRLQKEAGDKDIYIGTIIPKSEGFWRKATNNNMVVYKTSEHGIPYYKGRIK